MKIRRDHELPVFHIKERKWDEKLVFVCLGNICRSPMAEFVMKSMTDNYEIQSRATSLGNMAIRFIRELKGFFNSMRFLMKKARHRFRLVRKILKPLIILSVWMLQMFLTYVRCVQQTVKDKIYPSSHLKAFQIPGIQGDFEETYQRVQEGGSSSLVRTFRKGE